MVPSRMPEMELARKAALILAISKMTFMAVVPGSCFAGGQKKGSGKSGGAEKAGTAAKTGGNAQSGFTGGEAKPGQLRSGGKKEFKKNDWSSGGYRKKSDNPDVLFGRDFEDDFTTIEKIEGEMGEVTVRGKILDKDAGNCAVERPSSSSILLILLIRSRSRSLRMKTHWRT